MFPDSCRAYVCQYTDFGQSVTGSQADRFRRLYDRHDTNAKYSALLLHRMTGNTFRKSCVRGSKARHTYSRFEPIVIVTTRPDRRELTHDRLWAQSAVITADSTGESGVAGRELLANQNIRNEGVVITGEILSCLSQSIQVSCF